LSTILKKCNKDSSQNNNSQINDHITKHDLIRVREKELLPLYKSNSHMIKQCLPSMSVIYRGVDSFLFNSI